MCERLSSIVIVYSPSRWCCISLVCLFAIDCCQRCRLDLMMMMQQKSSMLVVYLSCGNHLAKAQYQLVVVRVNRRKTKHLHAWLNGKSLFMDFVDSRWSMNVSSSNFVMCRQHRLVYKHVLFIFPIDSDWSDVVVGIIVVDQTKIYRQRSAW